MKVESKRITVLEYETGGVFADAVLVSAGSIRSDKPVLVTVGAVGCRNIRENCSVGDFLTYEPNENEMYEVRLIRINTSSPYSVTFMVSRIPASEIFGELSRLPERAIWATPIRTSNRQEKFSSEEINFLREKLALFQSTLNTQFSPNQQQTQFVQEKLAFLVEAMSRQSKTDWIYAAMGVFVSIAMALGVSAANDDKFWQLIKGVFGIPVHLLLSSY